MFYTKEELTVLSRKELQKLCKQFKIKANKKNVDLVDDLFTYFKSLQQEEKELQDELTKENTFVITKEPEESSKTFTMQETVSTDNNLEKWISDDENEPPSEKLRDELMDEVERRAQEKLSKIPRFCIGTGCTSQGKSPSASLKNKHTKEFKKLDSLDVYVEKKRKRAAMHLGYHKKLKVDAQEALNRMKQSHNTPAGNTNNTNNRKSMNKNNTPIRQPTKDRPLPKKPAVKFVDKEISFNFVSKLQAPKPHRTSPRLNALKERNSTVSVVSGKKTPILPRKSVQFTSLSKPATSVGRKSGISKLNKSMGDLRSPAMIKAAPTSAKKTPIKFDLKESLKKPLTYKPHGGKLKQVYFADRRSVGASQRGDANKSLNKSLSNTTAAMKTSVKEITSKKVSTREKRRGETSKRRENKRDNALAKRRGICT